MDFLNTLEDNSILIIPNNIKDKVLEYFDKYPWYKLLRCINLRNKLSNVNDLDMEVLL